MKWIKVAVLAMAATAFVGLAWAYTIQTEDKGAPQMTLDGGTSGPVPFPHEVHQITLEDCRTCHELFPQEAGAIGALKSSGALKPKQVMNKQCTKCHKQLKREGKTTGPTTCKSCHQMG